MDRLASASSHGARSGTVQAPGAQRLSVAAIGAQLETRWIGRQLHCLDVVDSTNTRVRELGLEGAPDGTVVIAERQERGRGRMGRAWVSPPCQNLYLSVLLRTGLPAENPAQISLLAGVAAADAIGEWYPARIKWPNDVLIDGRKVCGILAEMEERGGARFAVLGIGVNLNMRLEDFPAELRDKAGSLRHALGAPVDRARVAARLLSCLEERYEQLRRHGFAPLAAAWRERSDLIGRVIRVQEPGGVVEGEVVDLDSDGALRLRLASGAEHRVVAGDVTVLGGYAGGGRVAEGER